MSPAFISLIEATEGNAKAIVFFSSFNGFFIPPLAEKIILEPLIISTSSVGSIEHLTSGPFLFLESTKCFSIILAPSATAPRLV